MRGLFLVILSLASTTVPAWAQPAIATGGVFNSASYGTIGLPNSSIAEGSVFTVFGSGMGGAALSAGAFPLPTVLGGTSVEITSGSASANAILLYVSADQLSGILPSSIPAGTASMTVTYNGQTSAPAAFQIVVNSFGIYTWNSSGTGHGVITDQNYALLGYLNSANPGDVVTIWGTGLGPVAGDEAAGPLPGNMTNVPVQVWVGSKAATILYSGRSGCCGGLDQISFVVPPGVSSCIASLAVQIGNIVSNFVDFPVATGTRECSDPGLPPVSELIQKWNQKGSLSFGNLGLSRDVDLAEPFNTESTADTASAGFYTYTAADLNESIPVGIYPSVGNCDLSPSFPGGSTPTSTPVPKLNAGTSLTLSGPSGTVSIPLNSSEQYFYPVQDFPTPAPLFLDPGNFTMTGPGGADVGPFSVTLPMPSAFAATNIADISAIDVTQGQMITWSGVDPSATISIFGLSGASLSGPTAYFLCTAPAGAGQFLVPPFVLLNMPTAASPTTSEVFASLSISIYAAPVSFSASGLDLAYATAIYSLGSQSVIYYK